ncbi:hypothetical protein GCM10009540_89120 [Streptomyces turgidiscabies]
MASCRAGSAASFLSDGGGGGGDVFAPAARGWTSAAANAVTVTAATLPARAVRAVRAVRRLGGADHLGITDVDSLRSRLLRVRPRATVSPRKRLQQES